MWELEDFEKGILTPLLLSYYELPSTMRRCFSSCAVFPKDHLFSRGQLVLHWMAQGYIESKANIELKDIAEEYFEKLAILSFFQDFEKDEDNDGKIIGCKMHDIVHDFAQFMSKSESLQIGCDEKLEIDCQFTRHLHLEISKEMQCLDSIYRAKCLRTLFLLSHVMRYEFGMHLSNSFRHFKCLRTLILNCPIKELPGTVENLIHLRFLFISDYVRIKELPETFCNLCNLQTLKIENWTCFRKLPQGMSKLINLRHLIFNDRFLSRDVVFPEGIGKLVGLRTLREFNICDSKGREGCKLGVLKNLNELRGTLHIYGVESVVNVDEAHNAQLKDKIHLHGLVLTFVGRDFHKRKKRMENDVKVMIALGLPPYLQRLRIKGYMGNTIYPNFPSLGQLRFLEELFIQEFHNVKTVGVEFLGIDDSKNKKDYGIIFPNLKTLRLWEMCNWKEWIGMEVTGGEENDNGIVTNPTITKIMPRLQSLEIDSCDKLESLPNYLLTAPLLKKLEITNSWHLQQRYRIDTGKSWHEISHIPDIMVDENWGPHYDIKVTLLPFFFFFYFIFSFQIYQLNINIWIGL